MGYLHLEQIVVNRKLAAYNINPFAVASVKNARSKIFRKYVYGFFSLFRIINLFGALLSTKIIVLLAMSNFFYTPTVLCMSRIRFPFFLYFSIFLLPTHPHLFVFALISPAYEPKRLKFSFFAFK